MGGTRGRAGAVRGTAAMEAELGRTVNRNLGPRCEGGVGGVLNNTYTRAHAPAHTPTHTRGALHGQHNEGSKKGACAAGVERGRLE